MLASFENYLVRKGQRSYTVECHLRRIRQLQKNCSPLTFETVERFLLEKKKAGGEGSSLNRLIITLRHFGKANNLEWCGSIPLFPESTPHKEIFSDEEIQNIIALPCPPRFRANIWSRWSMWLAVVAFSGMRASEVSTLTVDQVDWGSNNFILPVTKTTPRKVPIAANLKEPLALYMKDVTHYLFPVPSKRGHVWRQGWQKHLAYRIQALGIKRSGLTAHSFRHSFATNLWGEGVPLPDLMNIFGWKSVKTAMGYSHLDNKSAQKSINRHTLIRKSVSPEEALKRLVEDLQKSGIFETEGISYEVSKDKIVIEINAK